LAQYLFFASIPSQETLEKKAIEKRGNLVYGERIYFRPVYHFDLYSSN
jgi:hypothetical protein